ncbi:hypothetical protein [Hymenobacter cellulosilyticus]|uniref:DUF4131 domain-containing protein n=1 Tax=Hymenobacter cellulosilyticus TaxID=2932248 RepID=A0A8T9QGP0_9BACT|nr:hypothetical protein [Hymenobacter cellulosilyticus]UOQ74739.1 hypothetical protein MUN79_13190 [Hymenobacter cellulosilyticus]
MIQWAPYAFVRLFLALAAGVLTYLYFGAAWPDFRGPLVGLTLLFVALQTWANRQPAPGPTEAAGWLALFTLFVAGLTLTQQATENRRPDHLSQLKGTIEFYRAVVDDYTVVRPATYATTVRVSAVRIRGQWQAALGGIRVSVPRDSGVAAPATATYG